MTLVLGHYAQAWHFPGAPGRRLADRVATWRESWPRLVPLPHPSPRNRGWFARNPWFESELVPELRERVGEIFSLARSPLLPPA